MKIDIRVSHGSAPVLTAVVWVVTAAVAGLQLADPDVLTALQRDPDALAGGAWWRVLTPLLVQSDGWFQIITNLAFLAVIGAHAEWCLGRRRWIVLYLAGGITGQLLGYAWEPAGAGNSVAICGLAGGLLVLALRHGDALPRPAMLVCLIWVGALTGGDLGGGIGVVIALALAVGPFVVLTNRPATHQFAYRLAAVLAMAMSVLMSAVSNHHGPAVLAGCVLAALLPPAAAPSEERARPAD